MLFFRLIETIATSVQADLPSETVQLYKLDPAVFAHFAAIDVDFDRSFGADSVPEDFSSIQFLLVSDLLRAEQCELPFVVPASCFRGPIFRGAMKEQKHILNRMRVDQVSAFTAVLTGSQQIQSAGGEGSGAAGHIETIVVDNPELPAEHLIHAFLKTSVRTSNHQSPGPMGVPVQLADVRFHTAIVTGAPDL